MSFSVALEKFHWFGIMYLLTCFFTNQNAKIVSCILLFSEIALQTKSGNYFQIWVFPPIWGRKWRRPSMRMQVILDTSFRPPGFSPYMGREERRVQGLDYFLTCHFTTYFFHQHRKRMATNTEIVSQFWLVVNTVRLFDSHFSLFCFSGL